MTNPQRSFTFYVTLLVLLITICTFIEISKISLKLDHTASRRTDEHNDHKIMKNTQSPEFVAAQKALAELANTEDNLKFYKTIKEEAHCNKKVRIGEAGDGGKYVCNPGKAKKDCTLMSLGLNDQIQYDVDIFKATGGTCKSLGADRDEQNENTKAKYAKINGQLFSGFFPVQLTVPSMLQQSGRSEVEILKIDIEGAEFASLKPLLKDYPVCQILIEVHGAPVMHLDILQMMAGYGFRIFNVDPNPGNSKCSEYSLINEKCMEQFEATPMGITLPLPYSS